MLNTSTQKSLIFNFTEEDIRTFAPDLLITIGQNVVSKKVKYFLRKAHPKNHWHIDPFWQPDTFFALTEKIETKAETFFGQFLNKINLEPQAYYNLWDNLRDKKDAKHVEYCKKIGFSDFKLSQEFNKALCFFPILIAICFQGFISYPECFYTLR